MTWRKKDAQLYVHYFSKFFNMGLILPARICLYSLGSHPAQAHVRPTSKMDVFVFSFSSSSSYISSLSSLGVARPSNNDLAVIMT